MQYDRFGDFFSRIAKKGMILGLESLKNLCSRLGDPQNDTPCVHIAGTNGKGSVLKMTSACLQAAGYKVGCYFSPRVFDDEPSVTVNGSAVDKDISDNVTSKIIDAFEIMESRGEDTPTAFEIETLRALMCFAEAGCDICVVECGMGGRDDATNIIDNNIVCVMTPIGLDHMKFLGNTAEEIAGNKAGIFRASATVVSAEQSADVMGVLHKQAANKGCTLRVCAKPLLAEDKGFGGQSFEYEGEIYSIKLCGSHQLENAAVVIEVMKALRHKGFDIPADAVSKGLAEAVWHGRFELVRNDPPFVIDGAHNVPAALALRESVQRYFAGKNIVLLFGILADKQYEEVAEILAPLAFKIVTFTPPVARALSGEKLRDVCERYASAVYGGDILQAVRTAHDIAESTENPAILAAGSLYSLMEIRKAVTFVYDPMRGRYPVVNGILHGDGSVEYFDIVRGENGERMLAACCSPADEIVEESICPDGSEYVFDDIDVKFTVGEGSLGGDGFVLARRASDEAFLWIISFGVSNPFESLERCGNKLYVQNNLFEVWEIDISDMTRPKMKIVKQSKYLY